MLSWRRAASHAAAHHPRVPLCSYDVVQRPVPHAEGGYASVAAPVIMAPAGGVALTHYTDGAISTA